jgi:hypothetical protein
MKLISALLLFSSSVFATTFVEQSFPDSVKDAPNIVRGKVGSSHVNWALGADGVKRLYTFYELSQEEVLKGQISSRSVMLRELGGEKDGVGMQVSGTSSFERGEDVVVMLGPQNRDGSHDVYGMMMGKYNVERGNDGKDYLLGAGLKESLRPELRGHEHELQGKEEGHNDTHPMSRWSLDLLRQLIKAQAQPQVQAQVQVQEQPVAAKPQEMQPVTPEATSTSAADENDETVKMPEAPTLQPQSQVASFASGAKVMLGLAGAVGLLLAIRRTLRRTK